MPRKVSTSRSSIIGGNYPQQVWPRIVKCVKSNNYADWNHFVDREPRNITPPYFLVIDIHGFSGYCQACAGKNRRTGMRQVAAFLRAFFKSMAQEVHVKGGTCVKFIGDAILATHERKEPLIKIGLALLKQYHGDFSRSYPDTNVVVVITRPRECLRGFVMGNDYVDFSFWSPGLNYLFSTTKLLPEGKVYFVSRKDKAYECSLGRSNKVRISETPIEIQRKEV